jgi:hypothetical protein
MSRRLDTPDKRPHTQTRGTIVRSHGNRGRMSKSFLRRLRLPSGRQLPVHLTLVPSSRELVCSAEMDRALLTRPGRAGENPIRPGVCPRPTPDTTGPCPSSACPVVAVFRPIPGLPAAFSVGRRPACPRTVRPAAHASAASSTTTRTYVRVSNRSTTDINFNHRKCLGRLLNPTAAFQSSAPWSG